jgi:phosphate transport system substrate-binding protein
MDEGGLRTQTSFPPGTIVGTGYRIVRPIADGGMGAVFEVEQLATGARRALKVMHLQLASDTRLRARFVREARVGVTIASDHVAQVIDAGVDERTDLPFFVLELLDGVTLSRELRRRGPFEWTLAREVFRQLGHAVAAAHAQGIVHRDLKPSNVFLARSKTAGMPFVLKVLDFGIAEIVASVQQGAGLFGTPTWMAPEQANPHAPVGPTADVWALGLIAFSLFTGRAYWPMANIEAAPTEAMLRRLASEEIVPATLRAASYGVEGSLPPSFDGWFEKCVDRDPARRFPDGAVASIAFGEMMTAAIGPDGLVELSPIAPIVPDETPAAAFSDGPTRAPTREARTAVRRARMRRAALAIAGAALVAGGLFFWRFRLQPPAVPPASLPATAVVVAATPPGFHLLARVHGSNTIGAELGPALAEAFLQKETGATAVRKHLAEDEMRVEARTSDGETDAIEIHAHGSSTAFRDLANGTCDVGMASRRIRADEVAALATLGPMGSAASEHVIALDGIAVLVNPANPVDRLTKEQLAKIYDGETTRWAEVGGGAGTVALYARDDRSGTYDTFKSLVLGSRALAGGAHRYESSDELADAVAADANGIGFVGLAYVRSAKAVMVEDAHAAPLLPSPATVATEDYPLSRRLYLYAPPTAPAPARRFVDFALSDEGQEIVTRHGFVDLRPECDANAATCLHCSAELRSAVDSACRLSIDFRFDPASKQLDTRALRDLPRVAALLAHGELAGRKVLLLGFSDAIGKRREEASLSQAHAETVAGQLRARGVAVGTVRGFGAEMPVADDHDDSGRERNRRVEVWLR